MKRTEPRECEAQGMKVIVETSTLIFYLGEKNPGCQNCHCEFSDKEGQAQARGVLVFRVDRKTR